MSRFERPQSEHVDALPDHQGDVPAPAWTSADAEGSAAHIAELVRRTAERNAAPSPGAVPHTELMDGPTGSSASVARTTEQPAVEVGPPPAVQPDAPAADRFSTVRDALPTLSGLRRPSPRVLVATLSAVALLIFGVAALSNLPGSDGGRRAPTVAPVSQPVGYDVNLSDVITDCAGHSRGQTKDFFGTQNCVKATRSVATGTIGGRAVLFVTSRVEMATAETAASLKQVVDGEGTGNLDDLLREGKSFPGAPDKMPASGYTSVQTGKVITVAEAGYVDGGKSSGADPALRAAAAQVAALVNAKG